MQLTARDPRPIISVSSIFLFYSDYLGARAVCRRYRTGDGPAIAFKK